MNEDLEELDIDLSVPRPVDWDAYCWAPVPSTTTPQIQQRYGYSRFCDNIPLGSSASPNEDIEELDIDWDAYYWTPVPSKHVYPLPRSLSRRIPLDVLYNIFPHLDSETDRSSVALVCREGSHLYLKRDARVMQRLNRTTTLRIHQRYGDEPFCDSGCIRPSMHPTFTRGLRLFRNLRSLEIVDFVLASFGQLRRIILASPQLDSLVLRDGKYALPECPPALSLAPPERLQTHVSVPRLRRLELCHLDIRLLAALVDWFVTAHPPCQHVTDLTITEVSTYLWLACQDERAT
ncbi:uncharacterized protein B0H18DRAFT_1215499 [Fomitopsis serialis]|uniref:uncharacterized protein n=1 Tax=Fomitopsis serialis TaxID=139415 RepID=UPI002007F62E|nr:uncharacterized protein B0H18DRAFT_1215499 [Neoantrodia serialis]KAH9915486.1 hypothetical protein B0H18DRAFT_1215499 [Neoantrodia serialis]